MMLSRTALLALPISLLASAAPSTYNTSTGGITIQSLDHLKQDPLLEYGEIEVVHYYYDQWPTGIAVSREGRLFSNYPGGLNVADAYNGRNGAYTIAELNADNTGMFQSRGVIS